MVGHTRGSIFAWRPSAQGSPGLLRSFAGRWGMEDVAPLVAVRPMKAGDIFRVAGIEREAFGRPGAGAELEKELQLPQSRPCVATVAGAVVGYLIYWQVTDEFQLLDIAVAREFRCRGVAGQMLDYLVVEADTLLDAAIHLEVAAAIYEAQGHAARPGEALWGS